MVRKLRFFAALYLSAIYLAACSSGGPRTGPISANEDKGIKDVLHTYGGRCEYGIGLNNGTKFFWLKVDESDVVRKHLEYPMLPASGIAYTFFRNLGSEQSVYPVIRSILVNEAGQEQRFDFNTDSLRLVHEKFPILERTARLISEGGFQKLDATISRDLESSKRALLLKNLAAIQPDYGRVQMVVPAGFSFGNDNGQPILHLSAILRREKQNHPFSVDVFTDPGIDSIRMMNYQF